MIKDQQYWLHKLATLRIDRARGNPAPHKPLLLLVILEMAEKGEITGREVALSPDLAFRFSVFWSVVAQRRKQSPEVRLPFHHLETSGVWQPLMANGEPSPDRKLTTAIRLDPGFFDCLSDQRFRDRARRVLIETEPYFRPEERVALYSMLKIRPSATEIQEDEHVYRESVQTGEDPGGLFCLFDANTLAGVLPKVSISSNAPRKRFRGNGRLPHYRCLAPQPSPSSESGVMLQNGIWA